jgi:hypothetical protein
VKDTNRGVRISTIAGHCSSRAPCLGGVRFDEAEWRMVYETGDDFHDGFCHRRSQPDAWRECGNRHIARTGAGQS